VKNPMDCPLGDQNERFLPGHHLVHDRTECTDVRPRVGVLAFQLFGCHVLEFAENRAFRSEGCGAVLGGHLGQWGYFSSVAFEFRQPEVQQLRPGFRDHDVAGLQVSMHHTLPVC
jgi:hypothetical protein